MTSLPEYVPFPINLHGPKGFQTTRSGNRLGDYENARPPFIRSKFILSCPFSFNQPTVYCDSQTCRTSFILELFLRSFHLCVSHYLFRFSLPSLFVFVSLSPSGLKAVRLEGPSLPTTALNRPCDCSTVNHFKIRPTQSRSSLLACTTHTHTHTK